MLKPENIIPEPPSPPQQSTPPDPALPRFTEFVVLVSSLMGLTAMSIDAMLPALGQISADYGLVESNAQQRVITFYLLGFAIGQLFFGPLSDRFGRKPVMLAGLGFYIFASLLCMLAWSFEVLLAARLLQGIANGSSRILSMATVRDIYAGRRMAEVMSFVMMVFIVIPVLAPSIGAFIMLFGGWHLIFGFLTLCAAFLFIWVAWRLPETHPTERREIITRQWLLEAVRTIFTTRQTFGYTLSMGIMLSCLFTYITMSEQIFTEVYDQERWFPVLFGVVAAVLIASSFTNSQLVMRLGMRFISHLAMVGFIIVALLHLLWLQMFGQPALPLFLGLMMLNLFFYGLTMPNFNALAMEPMGRIAGTASSFVGAVTTGISAILSGIISQFYAGTSTPMIIGFMLCGLLAFGILMLTNRYQTKTG